MNKLHVSNNNIKISFESEILLYHFNIQRCSSETYNYIFSMYISHFNSHQTLTSSIRDRRLVCEINQYKVIILIFYKLIRYILSYLNPPPPQKKGKTRIKGSLIWKACSGLQSKWYIIFSFFNWNTGHHNSVIIM